MVGVDFPAGAHADDEFQAASALARAALLELSDDSVREYLVRERSFSPAWREAATFLQSTILATPAELEQIAGQIQAVIAPYARGARGREPRGARYVNVSVRAVPAP